MKKTVSRRNFIQSSSFGALGLGLFGMSGCSCCSKPFEISLAQWSLHKALFAGKMDALEFAPIAKNEFGIEAVEYVNQFYKDKTSDKAYMAQLKAKADDNGVKSVLIMVDGEGNLGEPDEAKRIQVVENHYKWVEAAKFLGCHSIRVNAGGPGTREELMSNVVDGLGRLSEHAAKVGLNVIVENHGGFSSDASWLTGVMEQVGMDNCGTLPDFGNFCIKWVKNPDGSRTCEEEYDRYKGTAELMPYAKAVSAKTHDFDEQGNEIHTDYFKIMKIVLDAGYNGYVGIEYEGSNDDEYTGIRKSKDLLLKVRETCSA
jgi:L-ribulose-5-phosphate 3-epimerase